MKKTRITALALALTGLMAVTAMAAAVQTITATLNPNISVTVDGKKQSLISQDGGEVAPIVYNGTTYLPVRAVGEALGKDVDWDQKSQTVILTTPTTQKPDVKPTPTPTPTATPDANPSYENKISALSNRVDALEKGKWNWSTYQSIDRDVDALDDLLERDYKAGKLTWSQYNALEKSLDAVDDRLDRLEDIQEGDDD